MRIEDRDTGSWYLRRGRISRRTYWLHYALPITAASLAAVVLDVTSGLAWYSTGYSGGYTYSAQETYAGGPFMLLTSLVLLVPSVSALVARLHDRDHSAWWLLWGLVPFAGGDRAALLHPPARRRGPQPVRRRRGQRLQRAAAGAGPRPLNGRRAAASGQRRRHHSARPPAASRTPAAAAVAVGVVSTPASRSRCSTEAPAPTCSTVLGTRPSAVAAR